MSVTNAISGIIVVGALLQIGQGVATGGSVVTGLAAVAIPARQHQRLRRLRGDAPHAGDVLAQLTLPRPPRAAPDSRLIGRIACSPLRPLPLRPTSSRPCCSSWPWPGCPGTRRRGSGNSFGMAGMAVALVATIALAVGRHLEPLGLRPAGRRDGDRRRDRPVAGPRGRDDRDARADRAAALVRRPGRGAGGLERLPVTSSATSPDSEAGRAERAGPARHPLRRGLHRRVHRRRHVHRVDRGEPQALGAHQVDAADAARQELPQRRGAGACSSR